MDHFHTIQRVNQYEIHFTLNNYISIIQNYQTKIIRDFLPILGLRQLPKWPKERADSELKLSFLSSYHILYIIAEAERKWVPTIKEVVTNRKNTYLKFRHV